MPLPRIHRLQSPSVRPLLIFVVCSIIAVTFSGVLRNGFVFDDHAVVVSNPVTQTVSLHQIFTSPYWNGFGSDGNGNYFRPLTTLSFAVDRALYGETAAGFHVSNLILHAIVACLTMWMAARLLRSRSAGLAAALIVGVHPATTEAVAHISARGDLFVALFSLLALREALKPVPGRGRIALYTLSALCAKESGIVVPALLVAVDVIWQPSREPLKRYVLRRGPQVHLWSLLSLTLWFVLRWYATGSFDHVRPSPLDNPLAGESFLHALFTLPPQLYEYGRLLVCPLSLSVDYGFSQVPVVRSPDGLLVALIASLPVAYFTLRFALLYAPAFAMGLCMLLLPLALVTNPFLPAGSIVAERYLYLPIIGLTLVIAYWGHRFKPVRHKLLQDPRLRWGAFAAVLLLCGLRTAERVEDWRSDETLFASAVEASPNSVRAHINYAQTLSVKGDFRMAAQALTHATVVAPRTPILHLRLAEALRHIGRGDAALSQYETAARLNPAIAEAWVGIGNTALSLSRGDDAQRALSQAAALLPGNPAVLNQLGVAYHQSGKLKEAQEAFRAAIGKSDGNAQVYFNLGVALADDQKESQAAVAFETAIQISPGLVPAHRYLAQIYDRLGDKDRAEMHRRAAANTVETSRPESG